MDFKLEGHDYILQGNALDRVYRLEDASIDCIVTSPPYFGLRNYGHAEQIGLEETPEQYIESLVTLFRECRRALKDTGTFWLNLGDSYWHIRDESGRSGGEGNTAKAYTKNQARAGGKYHDTYKPKDLMMIPARVAMALQADGWYLRSQIVWHKPNAMPESVTDRPTNDYEMVYLLSKSREYFYDADAIREAHKTEETALRDKSNEGYGAAYTKPLGAGPRSWYTPTGRNKRAVWAINTKPYSEAHFATMPQELADTCIKAGCPKDGVVMDPFGGAGTTAVSAISLKRHYILFELNTAYIGLAQKRIRLAEIEASQLDMFGEWSA